MADANSEIVAAIAGAIGAGRVVTDGISDDYLHDEALGAQHVTPLAVVCPESSEEVAAVLRLANEHSVAVTARGSGTGLSGSAIASEGGLLISFERMNDVVEIDTGNHVAVVQPGITLEELDAVLAPKGLVYPVYPGEYTASLGGNINTNAGGMRAVKYGVTRRHVLGLELVLASGETIRTGGKVVKSSSGYDLTQLVIGSEGTLGLVTEIVLRLYPRAPFQATVMAPFATLDEVAAAIPEIVGSGVDPLILEYVDFMTMAAMKATLGTEVGIPDEVSEKALAYLVVQLEDRSDDRLDDDIQEVGVRLGELGAIDVYVLPPQAAVDLIAAREKAFWVAKAANADDIIDVVVPRAQIPAFVTGVAEIAADTGSLVAGCGHAGDGNVHMAVFQGDTDVRHDVMMRLFEKGLELGGQISGEHGIGTEKKPYYLQLEDPVKIDLQRAIKNVFDPSGILNPGTIFD